MVLETAATFLGGWALALGKQKVGQALLQGLDQRLNPSDLERFLDGAIAQSNQAVPELFRRCQRDGPEGSERFLSKFFKGRALPQLQKPLQDEGKPDVGLLAEGLLKAAEEHSMLEQLDQGFAVPWMEAFVAAYFQETDGALRFQLIQADYCKQILRVFDDVKFAGIAVEGQDSDRAERLTDIFVMPDLQEESSGGKALSEADISTFTGGKGKSGNPLPSRNRQQQLMWEQRQQALQMEERSAGQKLSASDLFKRDKRHRAVLLGAPGSGKTTLLNYFSVVGTQNLAATHLPVLIRIRDLARHPDLSVIEFVRNFAKKDLCVTRELEGFFEHFLMAGNALILLDGLDEVADSAQRVKVVDKIKAFLNNFDLCPTVITSRPAGYRRDFFRTDEFPHYELLPFDDGKIDTFVERWYYSRFDIVSERQRRKASLRKALKDRPRIRQLARNPLLLTIVALIHRYQAKLPKERYKLYDKAVETLLTTWDSNKELSNHEVLEYLQLDDLRRLMERLAYWIHYQGGTGDVEGGTLIDRDELIGQLTQYICEMKGIKRYQAKEEAKRFLERIVRDRAGLLSLQGQDRYAFVHKTFQEYLCSQEILYLQEDDDCVPHAKNHIQKHLHDPHWREVLLLLVAQQTPKRAKASLKVILEANSDYEQWLHRDLLLAGSHLAENSKVTDEATINQILTDLVNLEICSQPVVSDKLRREVFRVISSLQDTPFAPRTMRLLETHQQTIDRWRFIDYQSELEPDKALQKLFLLLEDADTFVRALAAVLLGQLGSASDEVVNGLLTMLQDTAVDTDVRYQAARSLGQLGSASDEVVNGLLTMLQDTAVDTDVRSQAAESLGQLGNASEAAVNGLLATLQDTAVDTDVRSQSAASLGQLGNASEAAVNGLLATLQDTAVDTDVRSQAAASLGHLGNVSDAVVNGLLAMLQDTAVNPDVRYQAAESLVRLGNASDAVVNGLLAMLQDAAVDTDVRSQAAESLGYLGNASDAVVNGLLAMLQDTAVNPYVRSQSAESLVRLGSASDAVVNGLLAMLQDTAVHPYVRSQAAESLGQLGNASDAVVNGLLATLQDTAVHPFVRSQSAAVLGQLGNDSEAVVNGLLELLKKNSLSVVIFGKASDHAAQPLVALSKHSEAILPALVDWIKQHQHEDYVGNGIDALWELTN